MQPPLERIIGFNGWWLWFFPLLKVTRSLASFVKSYFVTFHKSCENVLKFHYKVNICAIVRIHPEKSGYNTTASSRFSRSLNQEVIQWILSIQHSPLSSNSHAKHLIHQSEDSHLTLPGQVRKDTQSDIWWWKMDRIKRLPGGNWTPITCVIQRVLDGTRMPRANKISALLDQTEWSPWQWRWPQERARPFFSPELRLIQWNATWWQFDGLQLDLI